MLYCQRQPKQQPPSSRCLILLSRHTPLMKSPTKKRIGRCLFGNINIAHDKHFVQIQMQSSNTNLTRTRSCLDNYKRPKSSSQYLKQKRYAPASITVSAPVCPRETQNTGTKSQTGSYRITVVPTRAKHAGPLAFSSILGQQRILGVIGIWGLIVLGLLTWGSAIASSGIRRWWRRPAHVSGTRW